MKLSVVMMIKNESEHLEECLLSIKALQSLMDCEIVVVDTGSEDNSVEIARMYTDRVFFHQWNNDFAAMRNITVSYAEGDWIFVMDGDEVMEKPEALADFLLSPQSTGYNTGIVRVKSYTRGDKSRYSMGQLPRLFRNSRDFKYTGAIHEQPNMKGPAFYLDTYLLHYGYISTDLRLVRSKFHRNTGILKRELEKEPENIYYWFQLSQSYEGYGLDEEALETCLEAYRLAKAKGILEDNQSIYNHLARVYFLNKRYAEVERVCLEAIGKKDGYIDIYYLLAKAQVQLYHNTEAIENYVRYLDMSSHYEDFPGYRDTGVPTRTLGLHEEAYADLCTLYCRVNSYIKTLEYKELISDIGLLQIAMPSIVAAYIRTDDYKGLKKFYDSRSAGEHDGIRRAFTDALEAEIPAMEKELKSKLINVFSTGDNAYSMLNLVRKAESTGEGVKEAIGVESLAALDFNKLPAYYGEVLYYLMRRGELKSDILKGLSDTKLEEYFKYLFARHRADFSDELLSYMQENLSGDGIDAVRVKIAFCRLLLISGRLQEKEYEELFRQYVKAGTHYIKLIYNMDILMNESINILKNEEETMLFFMALAEDIKEKDKALYLQYLKKALEACPVMAEGISIYLKELESELISHMETAKERIEEAIDDGNLLRAHRLISEYERTHKEDVEIISMKAVIAIMENRLNEAEAILEKGLLLEPENPDLLYNLKYLYTAQGLNEKAELI